MTKAEKVNDILNILDKHFPDPEVPLRHKDAYTLLISVLLSAQCTDVMVNKTTPFLFKQADNPYDMIKMSVEEIREIIRPCGLSPMKSKGIHGLSKILIEKYKGEVPNTFEELEDTSSGGPQNSFSCHDTMVRVACVSRRHTYPPVGVPLGINQWQECGANRKRFKALDSKRALEQSPSANHLLWQEILPCTKSPLAGVSYLFKIYEKKLTRLVIQFHGLCAFPLRS